MHCVASIYDYMLTRISSIGNDTKSQYYCQMINTVLPSLGLMLIHVYFT